MNKILKSQERLKRYHINSFVAALMFVLVLSMGSINVQAADGNVAQVTVGETTTDYTTLDAAVLAAEQETGDTKITMLADITLSGNVTISDKITLEVGANTLNLNGQQLNISGYLLSGQGNIVDNSTDKTGLLKVDSQKCTFSSDNAQVPIYNTAKEGFVFATVESQEYRVSEVYADTFEFVFLPYFGKQINGLLAAGSDAAMVDIGIRVQWTDAEGNTQKKDLTYTDEVVKTVYDSKSTSVFTIKAEGVSNFKHLTITPIVKSRLGGNAESCGYEYHNNIILNGDFENRSTGWTMSINKNANSSGKNGAIGENACEEDSEGNSYVKFKLENSGAYIDAVVLRQKSETFGSIKIAKGDTYKLCFDAKVESIGEGEAEPSITIGRIWLRGVEKKGSPLARVENIVCDKTEWCRYEYDLSSSYEDTLESLYFQIGGSSSENVILYIDNVSLVKLNEAEISK
ncbi:MAG: hypothetical protein IKA09_09090 [Lachnospiraceae bacterium]|nr:hypothetical protein [Lachnospiraceae bacterium]